MGCLEQAAWSACRSRIVSSTLVLTGMSKEAAMHAYIDLVEELKRK